MNKRITLSTRKGLGYSTVTDVTIDGVNVGYHVADPILDTFYGGQVWRDADWKMPIIKPTWIHLGSGACFLDAVIQAAESYCRIHPTYFKSMAGYTCNELDNLYIAREYGSCGKWQVVRYQRTVHTAKTLKACKAWIVRQLQTNFAAF